MNVRDCMTKNPLTVRSDDRLSVAVSMMSAGHFRRLPVVDGGGLLGIISEYDLKTFFAESYETVFVRDAMTANPFTVASSATLEHAIMLLQRHEIGALLVVDLGKLVGIITARDLWMGEPNPLPEWIPQYRLRK